jgi:SAM-dependent methyltransferase
MKNRLKFFYRKYFKNKVLAVKHVRNTTFNIGNKKQCYVCKKTFHHFGKFRTGSKGINDYFKNLQVVGSDVDNFMCHFCGSNDRTRHLFMFFNKLNIWEKFKGACIVHIAPEKTISDKIKSLLPAKYIMGDLLNTNDEHQRLDVTDMPFEDESMDILICNHVLEHVPDYKKAMREIYRVLRVGGFAILQTPYSRLLTKNFEEENINNDALRLFFYAQEDHVRLFGEQHFFQDLQQAGFELKIAKHSDFFSEQETVYYGVNKAEDLIMVVKNKTI